ncbi:MAG: aspartyl protease family protein [Alphaproteobacteria bacterium]|nr:aspartyl protease family protein [Alphaproteobacteria bacterium]MBU1513138.1 aspartyl protease family protein [Alphaproteobacteria bacterium]MBU2095246.1 aspartyl protease family protein [Alphaproteobacteria bacterium]MBU2152161.1 aspartyl protease family protein [Alphaproteobacteria bacterium]MBU2306792.1 aspartyl protease family protein [Alphaproteobacteria bacterium]
MTTRRGLLLRLGLLATAGGALFMVRDRLPWLPLQPRFVNGRDTPWQALPERGGLIEIPVTVNGTPVRAVVDSGAQFSAIDRTLAARMALPRTLAAPILAYGVSGGPSLSHTVRLDLALPGLAIPDLRAAALDLAAISAATGRDFQLLIGRDVLRHLVVEADFPRARARFLAREAFRAPRDAIVLPLRTKGGAPVIAVRIEDAPALDVLVDTGASGVLALSAPAATRAGLLAPGRQVSSAHSVSLGGLSVDRLVTASTIDVGGMTLHQTDVQIYTPAANAPAPSGLLGTGLFRQFRMALDLGGDRLVLVRPGLIVVPMPEPRR